MILPRTLVYTLLLFHLFWSGCSKQPREQGVCYKGGGKADITENSILFPDGWPLAYLKPPQKSTRYPFGPFGIEGDKQFCVHPKPSGNSESWTVGFTSNIDWSEMVVFLDKILKKHGYLQSKTISETGSLVDGHRVKGYSSADGKYVIDLQFRARPSLDFRGYALTIRYYRDPRKEKLELYRTIP